MVSADPGVVAPARIRRESEAASAASHRKRHIVVIPSWYGSGRGSDGGYFRDQALALQSAGHRVAILAPGIHTGRDLRAGRVSANHSGPVTVEHDGIPIYRNTRRVRMPRLPYRNAICWSLAGLALYRAYVTECGPPDLVHAHSCLNAGVLAALIRARYGVPFVVTEHSTGFAQQRLRRWERDLVRRVIRRADARIAVSPHLAALLEKQFAGSGWDYVPNILGDAFLAVPQRKPAAAGPFTFLCAARFAPVKNHRLLIAAFADAFAGDDRTRLALAGDGPLLPTMQEFAASLGIAAQVDFLGALPAPELRTAMERADAFVLASDVETFGVVVIEAQSAGLPVIATESGGPDHLVDASNGMLVPPRDRASLRDALRRMRSEAGQYDRLHIATDAIRQFGPESFVRRFGELIEQ